MFSPRSLSPPPPLVDRFLLLKALENCVRIFRQEIIPLSVFSGAIDYCVSVAIRLRFSPFFGEKSVVVCSGVVCCCIKFESSMQKVVNELELSKTLLLVA